MLDHLRASIDEAKALQIAREVAAANREAAVQIAHAITTHEVAVDDDYYTAVDDLKTPAEDAGAGFIGETGFGAGVFYLYINIHRTLLLKNLGGDTDIARKAIESVILAAATVGPRGKSASFASFARAASILAERSDAAPRTLAGAFLRPLETREESQLSASIASLKNTRDNFAEAYGEEGHKIEMDVGRQGNTRRYHRLCDRRPLMPDFLMFQLVAPIGAFDAVAVGERRETAARPSHSALAGLVGAALGLERADPRQARFCAGFALATRRDRLDPLIADYHTAQTPPARKGRTWATRRDELSGAVTIRCSLGAIITRIAPLA